MSKYDRIKDFQKGREYSRDICDQVQKVNNAIDALCSQSCDELSHIDTIAPGTTPDRQDIKEMKRELDSCVKHLYENHHEKERIIRHFLSAQQLCIDCLNKVYKDE